MSGHTPGPWTVEGEGSELEIWQHELGEVAYLRCLNPRKEAHDAMLADARLIAAAPELLEAATAALKELSDLNNHFYRDGEWPAVAQLRAAIAKAKGRSSSPSESGVRG
jgi:hypothetical protein